MPRLLKRISRFTLGLVLTVPLVPLPGADEAGRPVMRAFSSTEIQTQGPVRAFMECRDGSFLVGSNSLSAFDGRRWQRIDVPGAYGFSALDVAPQLSSTDAERVWVGAVGAIGYVERNLNGLWHFVSLLSRLPRESRDTPIDIRFVHSVGNGAVFVSGQEAFRWNGSQFTVWKLPSASRLRGFAVRHEQVWIFQDAVGLLSLGKNGAPILVRPTQTLPPGPIVWALPAVESAPESTLPATSVESFPLTGGLVGTADGVYRLTETGFESLPNVSAMIKGQEPAQGVELAANAFAVGTAKSGVIIATRADAVIDIVDRDHGLNDNAVYGLWRNPREILWIGLADGCALLDGVSSASVFDAHNGLERSLPRKVFADSNTTFVLTDKKLYRVEGAAGGAAHLQPVIAAKALFHDAMGAAGSVWVGGVGELWRLGPGGSAEPFRVSGKVVRLGSSPSLTGRLLYVDNNQLKALVPSSGDAGLPLALNLNADAAPLSLLSDARGEVWLSTVADGIHRYETVGAGASAQSSLREVAHYRAGRGLPPAADRPVLAMLGPKVFAFTSTQILVFDEVRDGFVPAPGFAGWVGVAASTAAARAEGGHLVAYWAAQRLGLFDTAAPAPCVILRVSFNDGEVRLEPLQMPGLDGIGDVTSVDLVESDDREEVLWIGGSGGLLRFRTSEAKPAGVPVGLALREVRVDGRASLELQPGQSARIGPGASRIEFSFPSAKTTGVAAVFYQTQLQGVESGWSAPQRESTREFTGLAPGSYVFKARRVDRYGHTSPEVRYAFAVIPPWYARWPAWVGYGGALVIAMVGILRWRLRLLRRQTERLDRLVSLRTRELELSNTAKSEFLENISHEIRNPLNGIVGLVNLLKPERLERGDQHVAQSLKSTAEHLRRVSEEVLDFSKLEFGYVTVEEKPFALRQTLRDLATFHEDAARRQGGTLALVLPSSAADDFVGDEAKIKTVVGNFLNNAIKYAPGTPIEIHADWTDEPTAAAEVFIAVTDRGPGIPAEEQELIFQKFVRGSNAKKDGVTGSGIGLATCRTLARRMGGAVGVESPVASASPAGGPGTSFHLWLPLKRVRRGDAKPAPNAAGGAGTAGESMEHVAEVLIVDDEEYNRVVLVGLAKELGYVPLQADNARAAVEIVRTHAVDLVFLDLELSGAKGDDAARALRKLPGGHGPLLIATTGHDSEEARQRCRTAGIDGFLLKPFDSQQVREVIRLARAARTGAAAASIAVSASARGTVEEPRPVLRAFQLYAQGANESADEAARRFVFALRHEIAAIRAGSNADARIAITSAAHRLRTLGALVHAQRVSDAAVLLQNRASVAAPAQLGELVENAVRETEQLITMLREAGVVVDAPGSP